MKPRAVIFFPDHWLAYSPSIINLRDLLARRFDVEVYTMELRVGGRACARLERPGVHVVNFPSFPKPVWRALDLFDAALRRLFLPVDFRRLLRVLLLAWRAHGQRADLAIGVDAGFFAARLVFGRAHLFSLEMSKGDLWHWLLERQQGRILSVIIQSEERFRYLFPRGGHERFLVQNAPIFSGTLPGRGPRPRRSPRELVYFGSYNPQMAVGAILDLIRHLPGHRLTLKGLLPPNLKDELGDLIRDGRLVVDDAYLEQDRVVSYLARFDLGFCLYDFATIPRQSYLNFMLAPSGKLFNYFAAGVPVIALDIPGLRMVGAFQAGVLVADLTRPVLARAVAQSFAHHGEFRKGCLAAARHFSYDRALRPFIDRVAPSGAHRP